MNFIPRKLYAKIEIKKLFDRFWENEHSNIGCRVTGVDRHTDRQHPTAIGTVDPTNPKNIYNDCTIDWYQVCVNMWSELGWVAHTNYHPSYIKYAEKLNFVWSFPESKMRSLSKYKVCCTSTMIVQLIGTKYVQIYEAVWAESHTQSTTPIRNGRTHKQESNGGQ